MEAGRASSRRAWIGLGLLLALVLAGLWVLRGSGVGPAASISAPAAAQEVGSAPSEALGTREAEVARAPAAVERKLRTRSEQPGEASAGRDPTNRLRGRTIDESGAPLAGVRVLFHGRRVSSVGTEETPERIALSTADGRFAIEDFPDELAVRPPRTELTGYALVRASESVRTDSGHWTPLELVLAPSATLEVLVQDEGGAPRAGWRAAALPVMEELAALDRRVESWSDEALRDSRTTGADGLARFELPARRRIGVLVRGKGEVAYFERCEDERLSGAASALPLVLAPGERRRVLCVPGITLRLEGVVLAPDRAPVADARVRVLDGEPEQSGWAQYRAEAHTDAQGRFALTLFGLAPGDALTVIAADGEWVVVQGSGARAAARRRIDVAEWRARPEPLELVLEPLLAIAGRVLDDAGAPVSAVVWAVPPGAPYVLQKGELGFLPISANFSGRSGEFEVPALRPGRHDLIVKRNSPRTYHRFPDIEAGTRDLVLRILDDRVVRVRLVVEAARPGDRLQPIVLWHQPRDPGSFGRPTLSATIAVDECDEARWPAGKLPEEPYDGLFEPSVEHEEGRTLVLREPADDAREFELELEPRQAGCYSVGLRGRDAEGWRYARRLSQPLWLAAGETTFVVRLELAATLEGRVPGPPADFRVELRDARGALVHARDGALRTALDADGSFHLDELPPGRLEVRVGTPLELDDGRWRWREERVVTPGEAVTLELR